LVQTYEVNNDNENDIAGKWHIDGGLNQITFMLLVNDIDEKDTHMQFALKSTHENHKELDRWNIKDSDIESKYEITHCIGKAGTLYVFQGGLGYHRAVYKPNSTRSIFHANFTTGHDIQNNHWEDESVKNKGNDDSLYLSKLADKII
jgi:dihydroxyacid dehydratase/phosphogluconate dehydratase